MKIGIMSDSHENIAAITEAAALFKAAGCEAVLHAGDMISPIMYPAFSGLGCRIIAVFGNNDGEKQYLKEKFSGLAEFYNFFAGEIGGRRFFMTHIPDFINEVASSGGFDVVVYGHTHDVDIRKKGGTLIINPGETGGLLRGRKTVVVLETDDLSYRLEELQC